MNDNPMLRQATAERVLGAEKLENVAKADKLRVFCTA